MLSFWKEKAYNIVKRSQQIFLICHQSDNKEPTINECSP
jgi:hypothetical protein